MATTAIAPANPPFWCRTADAARRGAAAILARGTYQGSGPETQLAHVDSVLPIPVVGITQEDELALEAELAGASSAGLAACTPQAGPWPATASTWSRTSAPEPTKSVAKEMICLTAHLDSHHNTIGALDIFPAAPASSSFAASSRRISSTLSAGCAP